jgi:acyl carrier protein
MSLKEQLIDIIFEVCDVGDHSRNELVSHLPLIGPDSPLGLDSLDSLEITVAVGKGYGARIDNQNRAIEVLATLDTLIDFIENNRTK